MEIKLVQSQTEGGQIGLQIFKEALLKGANSFGLATGSTPISIYEAISASNLDFSKTVSINLDEYVGISADHPESYHYFMREHLFGKKPFAHSFVPNGQAADLKSETESYDKIINDHPIDLQLLGLGQNGHIGFNEPGTSFTSKTHIVNLTENTIRANSRFFESEDQVPKQAISMGIASILQAKEILIAAYGQNKAQAVRDFIQGPVTEAVPASVLQKHPNVIVILDPAAASLLKK
ncbi:glucosamine-6-phosphate deaminase [Oenococcus kitaharae]|uniref:Glucosamine-6-phosphate deaminase n=1 Tax=Oenococcus kitaharae DSM 17330 TaxID=1045004 RepID=G9WI59_9LACO|nr:glucosamine-6-phosphate deaminase [Oenococcus kitaharae]EHN59181.1 Glucosamine-6-phosphate deaminase [Oenococcus kitaharae DSM 17330]OEY81944.1 glucosamine-6-phosphate deaminase [Oenococcus kitaharae]OEY82315.1 glucosamine-6-phosphate deaminase [Oenococcus kitaharae]OEY82721.1 glucosamine-6-phosphate deaminase [Oenococcus kitaharae]